MNAVTTDTLQKLKITQFQDIQGLVPGLSLTTNNGGTASNAALRGVNFDVFASGPDPTVALYLNDAPVQAQFLFSSLFDVGQVEVLRGPQGTTRGVSAPSGAITITTRKPDLSDFGGYLSGLTDDHQDHNAQAAINIPIIKDVLAIRVAGVVDEVGLDFVRSIHSAQRPKQTTTAERISLSFEPSDRLNAAVMYQHMDVSLQQFAQVSGPGLGAGAFLNNSSVNPPIAPGDLVGVEDGPNRTHMHYEEVTALADSRLFGQHFSYVGSYTRFRPLSTTSVDTGNVLPGVLPLLTVDTVLEQTTQEFRVASDPAPGRVVDYTVGGFYSWQFTTSNVTTPTLFAAGAFGPPGTFNPAIYNTRYVLFSDFAIRQAVQETSLFGSLTFHLGPNTELSGGVRHIWSQLSVSPSPSLSPVFFAAAPASLFGGACPAALHLVPSFYSGFCDARLPIPGVSIPPSHVSATPNIYNVSLSHHLTRDLLVYADTGTAFRTAFSTLGLQGIIGTTPATSSLVNHPAETSRAYEVGFKSTWLDGRARLNAALFRQRFHNLSVEYVGIRYAAAPGSSQQFTAINMAASVDALVQGVDLDSAFQVTRDWNIALQASYADGKIEGSLVPCNIRSPSGGFIFNTDGIVSLCPGSAASHLPLWNASLQSEYIHPVTGTADGFIRGLFTYYPENKRVQPGLTINNYSLVNLYAGVRSHDGAWEVSLFARNAFNTRQLLDRQVTPATANTLGLPVRVDPTLGSGYFGTRYTMPREVGVSLHYAWGSR